MTTEPTVFVVDDDEQARKSVCALVRSMGIKAESFPSGEEFLEHLEPDHHGCLVTDVRMLGMSGLELLDKLNEKGILLPVIVMTAHASTPITVRAVQSGAVTLLEKPYMSDDLWDAIRKALMLEASNRSQHEHRQEVRDRLALLTPSERQVLDFMVEGKPNKVIAKRLDISIRTVENRRRDIFEKTNADSVAELVRMVIEAGNSE